jgi:hypothetical protein
VTFLESETAGSNFFPWFEMGFHPSHHRPGSNESCPVNLRAVNYVFTKPPQRYRLHAPSRRQPEVKNGINYNQFEAKVDQKTVQWQQRCVEESSDDEDDIVLLNRALVALPLGAAMGARSEAMSKRLLVILMDGMLLSLRPVFILT